MTAAPPLRYPNGCEPTLGSKAIMDIKYLTGAVFHVWGERGTKRRFLQWRHPELTQPVTLLLEEQHIAQLLDALQRELPAGAYTETRSIQ